MTEIKLTLNDPANFVLQLRHAAEMLDVCEPLDAIADSIEEQVKPTIEEPTEFGSIVRGPWNGRDRLWIRDHKGIWVDETGIGAGWSELHDPEVLRIGVGEAAATIAERIYQDPMDDAPDAEAVAHAYSQGHHYVKSQALQRLRNLRGGALTAERLNAYDRAIEAVEGIA